MSLVATIEKTGLTLGTVAALLSVTVTLSVYILRIDAKTDRNTADQIGRAHV